MSQILNTLAQGVEYVHSSAAPVNLDGGQPAKALFAKEVDDLDQIVRRGLAFNVADLVSRRSHPPHEELPITTCLSSR
jgi:hypothetical protein